MKTPKLLLLAVLLLFAEPALAQIGTCGDYDADGVTTIGDMVAAIQYLFEGNVPPDDFNRADFDLCQKLTYRDQVFLINCVFACDLLDDPVSADKSALHPSNERRRETALSRGRSAKQIKIRDRSAPLDPKRNPGLLFPVALAHRRRHSRDRLDSHTSRCTGNSLAPEQGVTSMPRKVNSR